MGNSSPDEAHLVRHPYLIPIHLFSLTPRVNISNCVAIYRVRSTYRICFACKANISRLAMRGISNPTKSDFSSKALLCLFIHEVDFIRKADFILPSYGTPPKPDRIFGIALGDKTRACLRFAKFTVGRGFYSRRVRQALCTVLCLVCLLIHRKRSPLSRLRTRSSFGSNNPLDCYSLPKLPLRYLAREGLSSAKRISFYHPMVHRQSSTEFSVSP